MRVLRSPGEADLVYVLTPHVMAETLRLARQDVATNEQGIMGMYARALVSLEEQVQSLELACDHHKPRELNPHAAILLSFVNETDESKIPSYDQVEAAVHGLVEQLEALRASVEIVQSERDEAVGKLRSLGLAVVDAMCDQSSTCRATEHKPWCFGYQPAYGIGGNLPGAESTPATSPHGGFTNVPFDAQKGAGGVCEKHGVYQGIVCPHCKASAPARKPPPPPGPPPQRLGIPETGASSPASGPPDKEPA